MRFFVCLTEGEKEWGEELMEKALLKECTGDGSYAALLNQCMGEGFLRMHRAEEA